MVDDEFGDDIFSTIIHFYHRPKTEIIIHLATFIAKVTQIVEYNPQLIVERGFRSISSLAAPSIYKS